MKHLSLKFLIGLVAISTYALAQDQATPQNEDMYSLSLEELMNVPIKSASKKEETLFDAPLSSYTITRNDIDRAGSTSIMEALRMAPGVIVREQANGVYDIHIRGMEDLTRNNGTFLKANAYTLVMIDNRPVFNHGLGGTFWESLPVDINDVDRIEIVRGPSSPLFGPNAVTGVINIITKRMDKSKTLVNANVQAGTSGTSIANASVGKSFGKFDAIVTANYQDRQRFASDYYSQSRGEYVPLDTLVPNDPQNSRNLRFPHPSRSLNKWGVNGYLTYKPTDKISFDLSLSTQAATSQRVFTSNPLQYASTNNTAANLAVTIYSLKIRTSYLDGYNADLKHTIPSGEYDYKVADVNAEYDIKFGSNYTVTPGVSYQTVNFNDKKYYDLTSFRVNYFNSDVSINTIAGFVRSDLNFTKDFRVIAALRADKFSVPNKAYLAYEFAATYKLNSKNLIRAAITRSNSGSFIGYNYLDVTIPGVTSSTGNTDLKIFTLNMIELGYRSQLASNLQLDIDVFRQTGKNLTALVATEFSGNPPTQFRNLPTTATQVGTTISINYVPSEKIQFKPFITIQKTETKDFPSVYLDPSLPVPPPYTVTYSDSKHRYTPGAYGGFYFNYKPVTKLSINLSSYFFGKQTQYDASWSAGNPATANQYAQAQIKGKFMLNAKVSYEVVKGLNVFINGRNLFGSDSHEFYAADKTKALYLGGVSFNFNK